MRFFVVTLLGVTFSLLTVGSSQVQSKPLSNDDVIQMVSLGIGDDVIVEKIQSATTTNFDTSVDGLKALKAAKVSDAVLKVMINPHGSPVEANSGRIASISAGGKWVEYDSQDKIGAARVRFELDADKFLKGGVASPKIILFCAGGNLELGDFRPNVNFAPRTVRGQPQMEVTVHVDDHQSRHSWTSVNDKFLVMDAETTHDLIGAQIFKVELNTVDGMQTAEFSPAGLDPERVKHACGDSVFGGASALAKDLEYPNTFVVQQSGSTTDVGGKVWCWMDLFAGGHVQYRVSVGAGLFSGRCTYWNAGEKLQGRVETGFKHGGTILLLIKEPKHGKLVKEWWTIVQTMSQ